MKTEDPIPQVKRYGKTKRASLSRVIGEASRASSPLQEGSAFSERWRGHLRPANRNSPGYERLAKRHL